MVKYCAAPGCKNRFAKGTGITFHAFPMKKKQLLEKWVKAIGRVNWQPSKYSTLCSEHFYPEDFYPCQRRTQIKEDVVPSIFMKRPKQTLSDEKPVVLVKPQTEEMKMEPPDDVIDVDLFFSVPMSLDHGIVLDSF